MLGHYGGGGGGEDVGTLQRENTELQQKLAYMLNTIRSFWRYACGHARYHYARTRVIVAAQS